VCDHPVVTTSRDPLEGIERILIDGTNLLHAIRRGPAPAPAATLIGRMRAVIPAQIRIELVFDGPPDPGSRNVRVASGLTVRYSGRLSADALLTRLVAEAAPFTIEPVARILVVTDDNELGRAVRRHGATTARTAWLRHRLERTTLAAPSIGRRRAPAAPPDSDAARDEDADERRWRPGRGATTKRGNPRRGARHARPSGE
jgi:predicted RNA-binding protein with PIN domain